MTKMRENYIPPQIEVIRMSRYSEAICISGESYEIESGDFDADSDLDMFAL
jgi:hypothetical protein